MGSKSWSDTDELPTQQADNKSKLTKKIRELTSLKWMPEMKLHVHVCKHSFEHWGKVPGSTKKKQNKTGLKLTFFQYFTNETAHWEIIYNYPIKLKLSQQHSQKGQRDL